MQSSFQDEVLHGAISAINALFEHYIKPESRLKTLIFDNLTCYVDTRKQFFILYIDKFYLKYMEKSINHFADELIPIFDQLGEDWDGDLQKLEKMIDPIFYEVFNFLPQLLQGHK